MTSLHLKETARGPAQLLTALTCPGDAGGRYVDEPVAVDGNIVTSRFPADLPVWMPSILKLAQ